MILKNCADNTQNYSYRYEKLNEKMPHQIPCLCQGPVKITPHIFEPHPSHLSPDLAVPGHWPLAQGPQSQLPRL